MNRLIARPIIKYPSNVGNTNMSTTINQKARNMAMYTPVSKKPVSKNVSTTQVNTFFISTLYYVYI